MASRLPMIPATVPRIRNSAEKIRAMRVDAVKAGDGCAERLTKGHEFELRTDMEVEAARNPVGDRYHSRLGRAPVPPFPLSNSQSVRQRAGRGENAPPRKTPRLSVH